MIREILSRFRFLIFRKKRSEVDEELAFYLDQSIAAEVSQGLPASEAPDTYGFACRWSACGPTLSFKAKQANEQSRMEQHGPSAAHHCYPEINVPVERTY